MDDIYDGTATTKLHTKTDIITIKKVLDRMSTSQQNYLVILSMTKVSISTEKYYFLGEICALSFYFDLKWCIHHRLPPHVGDPVGYMQHCVA